MQKGQQPKGAKKKADESEQPRYAFEVGPNDVLFGRGNKNMVHPGNAALQSLIKSNRKTYEGASIQRGNKKRICRRLIELIQLKNGRFLRKIEQEDGEIPRDVVVEANGRDIFLLIEDEAILLNRIKQAFRYVIRQHPTESDTTIAADSDRSQPPGTTSRDQMSSQPFAASIPQIELLGSPTRADHANVSESIHQFQPQPSRNTTESLQLQSQPPSQQQASAHHGTPTQVSHSYDSNQAASSYGLSFLAANNAGAVMPTMFDVNAAHSQFQATNTATTPVGTSSISNSNDARIQQQPTQEVLGAPGVALNVSRTRPNDHAPFISLQRLFSQLSPDEHNILLDLISTNENGGGNDEQEHEHHG